MGNCFLYKRGMGSGGGITPEVEKTASGKVIAIHDSTEKPLKGLCLFGKNTQSGTPSPTAPVPMVSVGDGGSIAVSMAGKNLFSGWVSGRVLTSGAFIEYVSGVRTDHIPVPYGVNSFFVSGVTTDVVTMLAFYDPEKNFIGRTNATSVSALTWLAPENTAWIALTCYLTNTTDPIGDKVPQNVQIEIGRAASDYEPYKEPQTLTIQKPTDVPVFLPGIHVSEGGNYTDENGWQWICDEVDFGSGMYVQRIGTTVFDGSSDETWNYGSSYIGYPQNTALYSRIWTPLSNVGFAPSSALMCDKLLWKSEKAGSYNPQYGAELWANQTNFHIVPGKDYLNSENNIATMRQWLAENPITVLYELANPIETPLSSEELAQYAALHTYSPTTTIYNDGGAYMELKYIAKGG